MGGKTISEWSAEWWKWTFSLSTNQHPFFDTTGAWANQGQPEGSVFFLAGIFAISGVQQRAFEVPEGKYLFFPVLNVFCNNVYTDPPFSLEELRDQAAAFIDIVTEQHVSIDGVGVPDLFAHRAVSPVFNMEHPNADNILTFLAGAPVAGLVDPIASDGFWLMLEPLPVGTHVLNFGGTFGAPFDFTIDITDTITVVPTPLEQKVEELLAELKSAGLREARTRPLENQLLKVSAAIEQGKLRNAIQSLRVFQRLARAILLRTHPELAKQLIEKAQELLDRIDQMGKAVPGKARIAGKHGSNDLSLTLPAGVSGKREGAKK